MSVAADLSPDQSQEVIYSFLRTAYGLPDPISKIVTAQTGHETAGWTSNVYKTLNNVAGFGYTGGGNYYAYNSVEDSITDLVNWLTAHIPGFQNMTDENDYAQALKDNGYYTDNESTYASGISRYFNDALSEVTAAVTAAPVSSGILLLIVIFGVLFLSSNKRILHT